MRTCGGGAAQVLFPDVGLKAGGKTELGPSGHAGGPLGTGQWSWGRSPRRPRWSGRQRWPCAVPGAFPGSLARVTLGSGINLLSCLCLLQNGHASNPSQLHPPPWPCLGGDAVGLDGLHPRTWLGVLPLCWRKGGLCRHCQPHCVLGAPWGAGPPLLIPPCVGKGTGLRLGQWGETEAGSSLLQAVPGS